MSALFLAIPLTIFVLFVLPIWLWLHYSSELLDEVDRELAASETRLREMERYVTSDTFTLRSRFRQL
ncbi:hypothetical protein [Escherichia coli]|uniref:hypothetical protein n=1 Tax=Escherichia coli TaxID=562 RepID=UPI000BEACE93|nr:hypothetical protein [Escherichia coli]